MTPSNSIRFTIPTLPPERHLHAPAQPATFSLPARATTERASNSATASARRGVHPAPDSEALAGLLTKGLTRLNDAMDPIGEGHRVEDTRAAIVAILDDIRGTDAEQLGVLIAETRLGPIAPDGSADSRRLGEALERVANPRGDPRHMATDASCLVRQALFQLTRNERCLDYPFPRELAAVLTAGSADARGVRRPAGQPRFPTAFGMSRFRLDNQQQAEALAASAAAARSGAGSASGAASSAASSAASGAAWSAASSSTPTVASVKRKRDADPQDVGAPVDAAAASDAARQRDMQKVRDILRRGGFAVPDAFELEIPPTADKGGMEGETRRKNTAAVFRFRSHMLLASDIRQVMIELNSAFATQPVLQSFEALRALRRD